MTLRRKGGPARKAPRKATGATKKAGSKKASSKRASAPKRKATAAKRKAAKAKRGTAPKRKATAAKRKAAKAKRGTAPKRQRTTAKPKRSSRTKAAGARAKAAAKKSPRSGRKRAFRLSPDVRPVEVDVHVEVDPQHSDRFSGTAETLVDIALPQQRIELHAVDLRVTRPRLTLADGRVLLEDGAVLHGHVEAREFDEPRAEGLVTFVEGSALPIGHAQAAAFFAFLLDFLDLPSDLPPPSDFPPPSELPPSDFSDLLPESLFALPLASPESPLASFLSPPLLE